MRCEFLKAHRGEFGPIRKACEILKVSKSEYCDYIKRRKSNAQIEREALEGFVVEKFKLHKSRYGYRRINRELRKDGIFVSEKRVLNTMRKLGLQAKGATRKHRRAKAVGREDPPADFSLVFHDDQGVQYTSRAFQRRLESHGIAQSMSRPGNPWGNALAESFFKTLKRELVKGKRYRTREEARQDIFKYIELYYNRQRMHSAIDHNAPCDLERGAA